MLTNAEMDSRATFACLLLGQPTLRRKLRQGVFAALDQRIALRCTLDGMDLKETGEYIAHHVKLAGRSDTLFSDDAVALIHEASRGLPRQVNNLATQSLIAAYSTNKSICDESAAAPRSPRSLPSDRRDHLAVRSRQRPVRPGDRPARRHHAPDARWLAGAAQPGGVPRAGRPARRQDRPQHGGRSGCDPHPAAGLLRRADRPRRSLPRRGDPASPQPVPFVDRRLESRPEGQLVRPRHQAAHRARPSVPVPADDRAVQRRGLVWTVRDPNGPDASVADKRLLVAEPEFVSVLKQTQREINTLSPVLRSAWDGRPLAPFSALREC